MRKAHRLKENKSQAKPRFLVFFDSESKVIDNIHHPYLVCASFVRLDKMIEKDKNYHDHEISNFWKDVAEYGGKRDSVWVFAHNAGYDIIATGAIPELVKYGYRVTRFFEKGSVFIMSLVKKGKDKTGKEATEKAIWLLSSTNFFPVPLKELGKVFQIEKGEFDFENGTKEEALIYCKQDTLILKTAVLSFIDFVQKENLGCLAKTTPGQAFNAFRHRFMETGILLHDNNKAFELERGSYYGGRTECFQIGTFEGIFHILDINSMYPYVMKMEKYPISLQGIRKNADMEDLKKQLAKGMLVCAKVKIKTDIPFFPCRLRGKLVFPIGEFWTYLTTPEIIFALEKGMLQDVDSFSFYEGRNIFTNYVNYFYTKRLEAKAEGHKVNDMMYKNFLNTLYGKTGQLSENWEIVAEAPPEEVWVKEILDMDTKKREVLKCFGGHIFRQGEKNEGYNAFCAIAAHVTAYARILLWKYMEKAGWDNVYYCDTDSIFTNEAGLHKLEISSSELGMLKLEKTCQKLEVYAPKDYAFGDKIKMKGIKKGSIKEEGKENTWKVKQWPKLFTFLKMGNLSIYRNVERYKKLRREYFKGWVAEGGQVIPLALVTEYGENTIIPAGYKNLDIIRKKYRKAIWMDEDEKQGVIEEFYSKEKSKESKKLRRLILGLGGVKDGDYALIPKFVKRKGGRGLDELATELRSYGYQFEDGNALYQSLTN